MCFNVDTVMRVRAAMWVRRTVNPYDRRAVNAAIDAYRAIVLESRGPSKEQIQALASQLRHDRDLFNFACEVYQASKNADLFVTCRDMEPMPSSSGARPMSQHRCSNRAPRRSAPFPLRVGAFGIGGYTMARIPYTIERTDKGYALTVAGEYKGRFGSNAAAERFRKLVTSGQKLDARTAMLVSEARAERARMGRG